MEDKRNIKKILNRSIDYLLIHDFEQMAKELIELKYLLDKAGFKTFEDLKRYNND